MHFLRDGSRQIASLDVSCRLDPQQRRPQPLCPAPKLMSNNVAGSGSNAMGSNPSGIDLVQKLQSCNMRHAPVQLAVTMIDQETRSTAIAVASPPPMQSVATPFFRSWVWRAASKVTRMRAPDAPIGCPRAQAPPWMLTFS